MCSIPTTVLWPSRILELVVLLCAVQVPTYIAVFLDHHQELIGSFLMEVGSKIPILYHTTEIGLIVKGFLLEQYFSTVTLRVPQQEFSAVRYLMPIEFFRASMWGYILPPQVSPVHWREACSFSNSGVETSFLLGGPRCIGRGGPKQDYIIMSNKINKDKKKRLSSIISLNKLLSKYTMEPDYCPPPPHWIIGGGEQCPRFLLHWAGNHDHKHIGIEKLFWQINSSLCR